MARRLREALMKGLASLELDGDLTEREKRLSDPVRLHSRLAVPNWERLFAVFAALRQGWTIGEVAAVSHIDPWFLREMKGIVDLENELACWDLRSLPDEMLRRPSSRVWEMFDSASCSGVTSEAVGLELQRRGVKPTFKRVDTCAAEFPALTPYLYSTYGAEDESSPSDRAKVMILGAGPNRIGQGIEFDYCCVHAAFALSEDGFETIMVNCNPETVSTDYDTSDRLYFEPLTLEHVLRICRQRDVRTVSFCSLVVRRRSSLRAAWSGRACRSGGLRPMPSTWQRIGADSVRCWPEEGVLQPDNGIARTAEEALRGRSSNGLSSARTSQLRARRSRHGGVLRR